MKKVYLLLACLVSFGVGTDKVMGQLLGGNVFLQGKWLEVGVTANGSWGSTGGTPPGYHVRGGALDFSYDAGHDGWTVGTDPYYGSYFMPGTPFDGWSMQVAGAQSNAYFTDGGIFNFPGATLAGSVTGYSNTGGIISGVWTGTAGVGSALNIKTTHRLDTLASWLVVTTVFTNTSAADMPGVYYFATGDPDNDVLLSGGSFPTNNHISYQNDADHRVEVNARPPTLRQDAFSGLCTKDIRAKALIYQSWPPTRVPGNSLDLVWAGTPTGMGTTYYGLYNTTLSQDIAFGLIYNIGTIRAGDSAIISFAWIFSDTVAIDSAFPEPLLVVNGVGRPPSGPAPAPTYDTFSSCLFPGVSSLPVDIRFASDKCWSWSEWSWAPSTGLSSTTGTFNTINISALSGPTTYTITGTDSATRMFSGAHRVFYLTVLPCFNATNNGPICMNDTLKLVAHGDSTGATYLWYGPTGFTATTQSTFRTGLTILDTGMYYVVKIVGTDRDTVSTHVVLKPLPVVVATSNAPICSGNTLTLNVAPDSVGETFRWTGPTGFTSTLVSPSRTAVHVPDGGLYKVVATWRGCMDSGYVNVVIDSTPAVPTVGSNAPICSHRDTLKLNANDATAGVGYNWTGPGGFTSSMQNPNIYPDVPTAASGVYTVTVVLGPCKNSNTTTVVIDSTPVPPTLGSNAPICSGQSLDLTAVSAPGSIYSWVGPNGFTSVLQNPTINPATTLATGVYSVTATIIYPGIPAGCTSDTARIFVRIDSTPEVPTASSNSPGPPSICEGDTLRLSANDGTAGVTYQWTGPNVFSSTQQNPMIIPVTPAATGNYTVTVGLGGACFASTVITVTITPTPPITATSNSPVCTGMFDTLFLQATSVPGATFEWVGPYTFRSSAQNPFRTPVMMEHKGVYFVKAHLGGCTSITVPDTVVVRQTPPTPWINWLTYCQYYDAPPLMATGANLLWYTTPGAVGVPTPPVPSTSVVGRRFYYVTQTVEGCISAVDSIQITVYPKPIVTVNRDTAVCPHDTAVLRAVDTDPIAYFKWYPGLYLSDSTRAVVTTHPETNIKYTVVASNQFGCSDTAMVGVTVYPAAVLTLADSVRLFPGEKYELNPQTNCSRFYWFPPSGLSDIYSSNPVASPEISTRYFVNGITSWGCIANDSIDVYVSEESLISVPNAFAPGSGPNGRFKIVKRGIAVLSSFSIFDRWGVKVFETSDIEEGWDGTFKGTPQPQGVYIYQMVGQTSNGTQFVKKGNITLLR